MAGALAAVALALGGCGSSGGAADKVDTSGLDEPAATTTRADGTSSTTTGIEDEDRADAAGGPDCGLLGDYLVLPVRLPEEDGGEPLPTTGSMTGEEEMALSRSIGEQLPPELATRWAALIDSVEAEMNGTPVSDAEAQDLFTVYEDAVAWSAQNCPDLPPTWRCSTQAKFTTVGKSIGEDGTTEPEASGIEDRDDVLAELPDAGDAVVLDESDTAILWGWLDDDGFVIRTVQANEDDGLWLAESPTECRDEAATGGESTTETFEPVGEAIDE